MAKIGLDYGHGENTFPPSKGIYVDGVGYPEHSFNAKLGLKVKSLLEIQGHTVIEGQQAYKPDVPLIERTNLYNREKVDLVWSIHANANGSNGVEGRCAFYWHSAPKSKRLAEIYVDEVHKSGYSTHGSGLHAGKVGEWTNLHINRETEMPAVLTENGFMSNSEPGNNDDFELIFGDKQEEYTDEMAMTHVKSMQRYLGEDLKDTDTKHSKPHNKPNDKPDNEYKESGSIVDYMNDKKMDSSYDNRAKLAKQYGIRGYGGTAKQNLELLEKLKEGKPKTNKGLPRGVLKKGDAGKKVRKVQEVLSSVYFYPNKGAGNNGIDGLYGPNTADAVYRFQGINGLRQDGIYGPKTRKALRKAMR